MPATSPRLCITLSVQTDMALKRLAAAQGRPVAAVVREYLESATPVLEELAGAMESVRDAEASAKMSLSENVSEVMEEMQPHISGLIHHLRALGGIAVADPSGERGDGAGGTGHRRRAASTPAM